MTMLGWGITVSELSQDGDLHELHPMVNSWGDAIIKQPRREESKVSFYSASGY